MTTSRRVGRGNIEPRRLTRSEQTRVDAAAALCADVLVDGWTETVAARAAGCLDSATWEKLFAGRARRRCTMLAAAAQALLGSKEQLHGLIGSLTARALRAVGMEPLPVAVARQLAEKIPIPVVDEQTAAVARGMQVIGLAVCLGQSRPLVDCQCFIDLALSETKTRVKAIVSAAVADWTDTAGGAVLVWGSP